MGYRWSYQTDDWEYFNERGEYVDDLREVAIDTILRIRVEDIPEPEDDEECPIPHGDEEYWSERELENYDDGSDCIIEIDHSQDKIRGPF